MRDRTPLTFLAVRLQAEKKTKCGSGRERFGGNTLRCENLGAVSVIVKQIPLLRSLNKGVL